MVISSPGRKSRVQAVSADSTRRSWSLQTKVRTSLRVSAPGSRWASQRIWKPLQMPSTGSPASRRLDHLGHHRREPGDRAAAQVVAVGEAAGQDHRVDPVQAVARVPERDRLGPAQPHRAQRVMIIQRARKGDDADLGRHQSVPPASAFAVPLTAPPLDAYVEGLDHRVGQQRLRRSPHLGEPVVVELTLQLELEPLALAYRHPGETQPVQRAGDRLALRIQDLRLRHHIDHHSRHGREVYPAWAGCLRTLAVSQRIRSKLSRSHTKLRWAQ